MAGLKPPKAPAPVRQRRVKMPKTKVPKINSMHLYDTSPMGYKKGAQ
jgi:hypothetical protein